MKEIFKNNTTVIMIDDEKVIIQHESKGTISKVNLSIHQLIEKLLKL